MSIEAHSPQELRNDHSLAGCTAEPISLPDGELVLYRQVFSARQCTELFLQLMEEIKWEQHELVLFGRTVNAPRLSAWHGDPEARYEYSGVALQPNPWTESLLHIKTATEALCGSRFNSVLANLYRDGKDSVGWHSDNERSLGPKPIIASVSLGATRRFVMRHKRKRQQLALSLEAGSVLVMAGETQRHWLHHLPKTREPVGPRLNLTYRSIVPE